MIIQKDGIGREDLNPESDLTITDMDSGTLPFMFMHELLMISTCMILKLFRF